MKNAVATLTITPAKEIPLKDQIIFGYEKNGIDYHLASVDPKSKDVKVKLLGGEDGSGTIAFTYNSTATCPAGSTTTSRTSTIPLKPAPELSCP
jgi:hypothetical protein